ncbi:MAG: S8 family serine peptidase, partial [Clostridia bacterium]|nr:S8 family serine peptidase [Clostridia bacterium]
MIRTKTPIKLLVSIVALLMVMAMIIAACTSLIGGNAATESIKLFEEALNNNWREYLDDSVVMKLPDTVKDTDDISLIIRLQGESILDSYEEKKPDGSFTQYAFSEDAEKIKERIAGDKQKLLSELDELSVEYETGADYSAVISGFEIVIKAKDFEAVCKSVGNKATVIVGEEYKAAETQRVDNSVNVYETGIFNSAGFAYDGTGMVIAVLDTGLDYNHTAFSLANFGVKDPSELGLTMSDVAKVIADTQAAAIKNGLTASDVYINDKVPFGFDYADKDFDVFPINSDHGTHVSGVIAGKDDTITGVAPNAQLVEMKIFSDIETSARTSWILSALEDCVVLGVDVINMSIGTACGFSRENDKETISGVYDRIRAAGISMVVAASNSYNSTYGSEKNGNLGLTSNPDSATIGSPATYKGAMSVASISGVKTPFLLYKHNGKDTIIYFTESSDRVSEEKNFYDDFFTDGSTEAEIEYVTIPGTGYTADYSGLDVKDKIVLISRGISTFEEKARTAQKMGAAGVIIYNNVSGDIKMNVGDVTIPVCSISQDDGEMLAEAKTGTLKLSRSQTSGPFMSDFSSWGPTPDLELKPEITAHGGSILSAVPGQDYDRISGTSMACPNISGVTALLRQYVIAKFPAIAGDNVKVAALVNRLMMSTADIVYNTNGLPYSVRKQGAGLANLNDCAATMAYIMTYDREDGSLMDKSKIELGDDPDKTGVYTLKFSINNFGSTALSYDLSAYVMTEGVSETKTNDGKTTVTEDGYILDGAKVEITMVKNGALEGTKITVNGGSIADVTVTVTLSDSDMKYLDESFENGMYVEGFIVLDAVGGTEVDLGIPYLGFYGDWTRAPIFDLDYFETNKDELDDSIDILDKTLPDAYATRPIGGLESDYVSYLGSYYFEQAPGSKLIAADRKYASLSNATDTVNSLRFVWAGLLRNVATMVITITEDSTGEVVYERVENDIRKSYGDGGSIYPANVDIEFSADENNLKNNTQYTVNLKAYMDYGDGGEAENLKNEFEFPFVTDFEAPIVTDCEFYTEYDRSAKKTRLYAKVAVYDNHYSMAIQPGYVSIGSDGYLLTGFDHYMTQVYSEFNSTTYVVYELTDYVNTIREQSANPNTFTVVCYDYAMNQAAYEIQLPDDFEDFYFPETENGLTLSPNEVYTLNPQVYPGSEWPELLEYISTRESV